MCSGCSGLWRTTVCSGPGVRVYGSEKRSRLLLCLTPEKAAIFSLAEEGRKTLGSFFAPGPGGVTTLFLYCVSFSM